MSRRSDITRSQPTRHALGQQLRDRRNALGFGQRDIATMLGLSQSSLTSIERANRDILASTLVDVAAAVGLEVALVAERQVPLLDLTAAEIRALADCVRNWLELGDDTTLRTALTKLTSAHPTA